MNWRRTSYLAVVLAAGLGLHGCADDDVPPQELRVGNCPEIFASGFRNPWRWSFDRQTGDLWVGDVGQGAREEVDKVVRGGNYGWRCFEGTRLNPQGQPCGAEPNLLPPVAEYERVTGTAVTGGYVYRGTAVAGLAGRYVFGDFGSRRIWHIDVGTPPTALITGGFDSGLNISSFGEGEDREIYVVHYGGTLHQLGGTFAALTVPRVFAGLNFTQPVAMLQAPGDDSRWFVLEQRGLARVFDNDPTVQNSDTFLDISARVLCCGEMGLLGMAFHPGFPGDPRVFVHYTNSTSGRVSRISEFRLSTGSFALDPNSERILLTIRQPETNHNGGHLAFGPDGYLYIGMGDGGGANDQHGAIGNAQLMTTLLGKMLRIDVNGAQPYAIPPDNPFSGFAPCGPNA
jgi:glucose/arabinose dehydrogenase